MMDIDGISLRQPSSDGNFQTGERLQVKVVKLLDDGSYIFNSSRGQFKAFAASNLDLGVAKIIITAVEPRIEVALLNSGDKNFSLQKGMNVAAEIIGFKDGIYTVKIGDKAYPAIISPPSAAAKFIAEIMSLEPLLELKAASSSLNTSLLPMMAKELASFNQKDLGVLMKMFSGGVLTSFLPDEIRRIIKDGGNFFENKLLKGLTPVGDAKTVAYEMSNDIGRENITKMQIANVLMREDFFSFFEGDELDFDSGVMRFHREADGALNLYMKLNFTNLGETVLSFAKSSDKGFYVTISTLEDISKELEHINIDGCRIRWRLLKEADKEIFTIKKEDFGALGTFDIKI